MAIQEPKKTGSKSKKSRSLQSSAKTKQAASIPIPRDELFRLHDIADALKLLRDIAEEAPELQLIQVEILFKKASHCAWDLIHEVFDSRWQERNPDVDLIRKD